MSCQVESCITAIPIGPPIIQTTLRRLEIRKKKNEISHRAAVTMTFVQHTNNKSVYIVLHG